MADTYRCPACGGATFPVTEFGTGRLVARVCESCDAQMAAEHAGWCDVKYGCDPEEDCE